MWPTNQGIPRKKIKPLFVIHDGNIVVNMPRFDDWIHCASLALAACDATMWHQLPTCHHRKGRKGRKGITLSICNCMPCCFSILGTGFVVLINLKTCPIFMKQIASTTWMLLFPFDAPRKTFVMVSAFEAVSLSPTKATSQFCTSGKCCHFQHHIVSVHCFNSLQLQQFDTLLLLSFFALQGWEEQMTNCHQWQQAKLH